MLRSDGSRSTTLGTEGLQMKMPCTFCFLQEKEPLVLAVAKMKVRRPAFLQRIPSPIYSSIIHVSHGMETWVERRCKSLKSIKTCQRCWKSRRDARQCRDFVGCASKFQREDLHEDVSGSWRRPPANRENAESWRKAEPPEQKPMKATNA